MSQTARLTARHGALLVVDLQEKLLAAMADRDRVVAATVRLIRGAKALGMPIAATEQYPEKLGPSVPAIAGLIPERAGKTVFHACAAPQLLEQLYGHQVRHVTLAGIEAHVCIAQTALELMNLGFVVQVAADAVASRHRIDREFALRRLERAGVVVSTAEAVLFEWTERSDRDEFKAISAIIKESEADRRAESDRAE
jgi:nicotinamidase-related amidase